MKHLLLSLAVIALLVCGVSLAAEKEDPTADLPAEFREWLTTVELLITDEERAYFLSLEEDFRRRAFIEEFWNQRDPFDDTAFNELRQSWQERAAEAISDFGSLEDQRAQVLLLNGEPLRRCLHRLREIEIWFYAGSERSDRNFLVIFERANWKVPYRIWEPWRQELLRTPRQRAVEGPLSATCQEGDLAQAVKLIRSEIGYEMFIDEILSPAERPESEWVDTFAARGAELPDGAETFTAELSFEFPGRHQQRTVVQGLISVPRQGLGENAGSHHFLLTGEVVKSDPGGADPQQELFERFRYRFEVPARSEPGEGGDEAAAEDRLPLVFQRYLRPGHFTLLLKLEDLFGRRFAQARVELEVPKLEEEAPAPKISDSELYGFLAEADAATAQGERIVRLLPPPGVVHTGLVRFTTLTVGDIDRVTFLLDDQPILTKNRPPYSVELDLGEMPGIHRLRALAYDRRGEEAATDEILLNPGGQSFRVRLVEPRKGKRYERGVRAVADVQVPDGEELDRLELYVNEELAATLYQPPWTQPLELPEGALAYVRAVGYLADGNSSENLVFVNAPAMLEEIEVQFVELYASVYDERGRPVFDLEKDDFAVSEDGVAQTIRRFEWVSGLPIHTALLIDTSSSMEDSLEQVGDAALAFVEQTIQPKDRASLITFTARPDVAVRFTSDVAALSSALAAMRAEGGTALYDSLVFALHYFHGIKGQKALLLLSDGQDEASVFDFDSALQFARRAGVTIYAIGLAEASLHRGARKVLRQLADETGGRSFFVEDVAELEGIYASIQEELRSQYLVAYQSSSTRDDSEFRRVVLTAETEEQGKLEVRTMSGYYP